MARGGKGALYFKASHRPYPQVVNDILPTRPGQAAGSPHDMGRNVRFADVNKTRFKTPVSAGHGVQGLARGMEEKVTWASDLSVPVCEPSGLLPKRSVYKCQRSTFRGQGNGGMATRNMSSKIQRPSKTFDTRTQRG